MNNELKKFNIDLEKIPENNNLLTNIQEAIMKMQEATLKDRFEVVLNNNLICTKEKTTLYRTILGCRISYTDLDKNISFIVREDKEPSYEELQQELQRKDNIINELKNGIKELNDMFYETFRISQDGYFSISEWELKNFTDKIKELEKM